MKRKIGIIAFLVIISMIFLNCSPMKQAQKGRYSRFKTSYTNPNTCFNDGVYYSASYSNPYSSSSSSSYKSQSTSTCGLCDGTGKIHDDVPTYGNTENKWCEGCHAWVHPSHCHRCKTCPSCGGKGYR